ncbi:MAG: mechanosensitive ion channel family protein [Candidatus Wenzhouxiangella sp. M2_3B_020]
MPDLNLGQLPIADLVASVTVLVLLAIARVVASRAIRARSELAAHQQRRWIATIRNVAFALGVVALVLIWAPQLQTFALSLTAVALAIVIATKELLLCFSGAVLRASTRAFSVGDWIEVAGIRGEVVDHSVFATTVYEFDNAPGSYDFVGRTAIVPNSTFLTSPVRNLSAHRKHLYHGFDITFPASADVFGNRDAIEKIVAAHAEPYEDTARQANETMAKRAGVDLLHPAARVRLLTTDVGHHRVRVTLFCPLDKAEALQEEITRDVALALRSEEETEE